MSDMCPFSAPHMKVNLREGCIDPGLSQTIVPKVTGAGFFFFSLSSGGSPKIALLWDFFWGIISTISWLPADVDSCDFSFEWYLIL